MGQSKKKVVSVLSVQRDSFQNKLKYKDDVAGYRKYRAASVYSKSMSLDRVSMCRILAKRAYKTYPTRQ